MIARRITQLGVLALLGSFAGCGDEPSGEGEGETAGTEGETGDGDGDQTGDGDGDPTGDGDGDDDTGSDTETDPGPQGVFVAVGDGGRRASSTDGLAWDEIVGTGAVDTQAEMGEEDILRAVAVGDGVIVAVGGGGTDWNGNAMIMRSTDGVSWEEDLLGGTELDDRKLTAVGFANGVFIAGGHQTHILRSTDAGLSWTRVYPEHHASTTVYGVAGHEGGDVFVLVGMHQEAWDQPKITYVQRSTDGGQTFEAPTWFGVDGDQLNSIASNGELFVAVGSQLCLRSADGAEWEPCGLAGSSFGAVSFTRDRFIVTYLDGVSTSSDGLSWSAHVPSVTGVPGEVAFGNGMYVGVRYYDRGTSEALSEWSFVTHGGFPLRDLAFLPLE
ncbi:MAG TPA: hypothetical protein VM869_23805 [Enhygromyxa sp.]|nr:hypothetical protein [Enhygromyxa sp.]